MANTAVLGAGSWGTALAIQLARNQHHVSIWDCDEDLITNLQKDKRNSQYLPEHPIPNNIIAKHDLASTLNNAEFILSVVPSYATRTVCEKLLKQNMPQNFAWATKGFEKKTNFMMHQVVEDVLGNDIKVAVLSGPSFAKEVASNLPTAVTLASNDQPFATQLAQYFHSDNFRVYTNNDIVGVEIGGTVKNVLAIAAGIIDGLGFGANARAALITRGLAEMMRFGQTLGANPTTLMGLAGMGDLVLTCTDNQSRNRSLGLALAKGETAQQYMGRVGQAVEGFHAAQVVHEMTQLHKVEMPICEKVWQVLNSDMDLKSAIAELLGRDMKAENI